MRWLLIAAGSLAFLGGCTDHAAETEDVLKQFDLTWTKLKDGSQFARADMADGSRAEALRCWPIKGRGFECLRATVWDGNGSRIRSVSRTSEAELPELSLATGGGSSGYSCMHLIGFSERIERNGSTLISNTVDYGSPRWSRGFVNRYMAENGVEGPSYFGCLDALDAVMGGSLETLGTTSVTKAMLR